MKNTHPMITATTSRPVSPSSPTESSDPVVRLRLNKPPHWDWELTTTADKLPVVQLLDKDGRLLVETTGRTAQRARGSFREGMKTYEKFPVVDETSKEKVSPQTPLGNRNIDGFSSKFGPSEFGFLPKKSRSAASVSFKEKKKGDKKIKKRHSSGVEVALKQLEEEGNNQDKTLNRYSAGDYLRKQIVDGLRSSDTIGKTPEEVAEERCNKVRAYLRGQSEAPRDEKLKELKEYLQASRSVSAGSTRENLSRIKDFLQHKIREKMEEEKLLSSENRLNEIRKRYSDYVQGDRKNYRTRKVRSDANIRFDPEVYERERVKLNKRSSAGDADLRPKPYGRSRSAVVVENPESEDRDKMRKRTFSGSDKRKVYRKTKSDVLLSQMETSVDSEKDFNNPPRRIKSQDNMERSWREYRERKKHERLHKDCDNLAAEEDFMSKPRWKDFQGASCSVRNCRICENMKNVSDPLEEKSHDTEEISQIPKRSMSKESISLEDTREEDLPVNKRPETQLQENYLLLDASTSPTICKVQVNNTRNLDEDVMQINSSDFGYNSMQKNNSKEYKDPCVNSNVKKSDTFKIVDGSENINEDVVTQLLPTRSSSTKAIPKIPSKHSGSNEPLTPQSNEDIARDYFKRVYELLKQRQEDARRVANDGLLPGFDDTSSSNHIEEAQRKRRRRRRKENVCQGDEIVAVGTTQGARDAWNVQRLLVNADPTSARLRRPQLQEDTAGVKRPRHPAPPPPSSSKVNVKDISKYFGSTNKENSPQNGVSKRRPEESTEKSSRGTEMGSNLSRHNGKGLTGRRTQSSGNLCDPKGKLNTMGKILVPCSGGQKERYKFCGSLPNHLDGKDVLDDDPGENNNVISDTMTGDLGGTLPHKKRSLGVHFSDGGPTGTLDLVKHRSQDSLDGDPWRYQQSSDLDLVRCKHGNFDVVRRNQSVDTVDGDSSRKYVRGVSVDERCHRGSDLDLVGTLPKRRQDSRRSGQGFETSLHKKCGVESVDDDMLMKLVHKPDCELMKHRQFNRCVDLGLSKLTGSEPQDQGYASERSPEDEHPPSLPGQPFPSVTPVRVKNVIVGEKGAKSYTESTFRVTLQKSSRGLGLSVSGGGTAGPVRVKRLFPQQPAALSNKLQSGDILLAANGIPLTGLTNYEALEVLRTTPSTVELVVCRPPGDATITPPGAPPQPPVRREPPPPLRILKPLPPLQIEPCGEFDIEMTKVGGSLGFTLRKADSSALGHYVRALVREPALSDGRIQPGDKIVAVDGAALSPMSHEEAVALLRQCGPRVKLRLYRDLAQTPVSALSPTEPDHPLRPPRTSLRQEAVDMLCDLAVRKLSPGTSNGSSCRQSPGASCSSPRRLRRPATRTPTTENDQGTSQKYYVTQMSTTSQADTSDSDQCSIKTQITNSQPNTPDTDIINPPPLYDVYDTTDSKPPRPNFLDLSAPQGKPHFQFSIDSDSDYTGPIIITESDSNLATDCDYDEDLPQEMPGLSCEEQDNNPPSEPASMPPILSSTSTSTGNAFSYKNPAYQSANPACGSSDSVGKNKAAHSSDQDIPGKVLGVDNPGGSKGLLKWKGVMFTPNDGADEVEKFDDEGGKASAISPVMDSAHEQENQVFMVELTRGWNSRLGFSLQSEGENTVISVVHADSVAAKDGRLRQGDVLLMVNDESVEHMSTAEIIDLLRKIRGSIGITVMRKSKSEGKT